MVVKRPAAGWMGGKLCFRLVVLACFLHACPQDRGEVGLADVCVLKRTKY